MIDLVEFLEARLAEDEAIAQAVQPLGHTDALGGIRIDHRFAVTRLVASGEDGSYRSEADTAAAAHFRRHDPARVLREVEAKRRILAEHPCDDGGFCGDGIGLVGCNWAWPCPTARLLALPYADHPDYSTEWSPS